MIEMGKAKVYIGDVCIGETSAAVLTMRNGNKLRMGDPAAIFELEQTPSDSAMLKSMKIATGTSLTDDSQ